jgi:hypothetical protein
MINKQLKVFNLSKIASITTTTNNDTANHMLKAVQNVDWNGSTTDTITLSINSTINRLIIAKHNLTGYTIQYTDAEGNTQDFSNVYSLTHSNTATNAIAETDYVTALIAQNLGATATDLTSYYEFDDVYVSDVIITYTDLASNANINYINATTQLDSFDVYPTKSPPKFKNHGKNHEDLSGKNHLTTKELSLEMKLSWKFLGALDTDADVEQRNMDTVLEIGAGDKYLWWFSGGQGAANHFVRHNNAPRRLSDFYLMQCPKYPKIKSVSDCLGLSSSVSFSLLETTEDN